jgi:single-strand DNA-binding protein
MSSYQKVIIAGNVGKDPELRYTASGAAICNLSIATSRQWKDKQGEKQEETEWHRVTFFDKLAEIVGEYTTKGSKLLVEGRLKTRKYTDKEGIERYATEIVAEQMTMLGGKAEGQQREGRPAQRQQTAPKRQASDDFGDDIPF